MTTDPWLSDARREAQRQREWALRDRVEQRTHVEILWRGVIWSALCRASVVAGLTVVGVWLIVEVLA